ncbi:acyl-CoA carboxylase subunit epsilon [Micromonospora sp. WMMD730]|uniref:acyl-CoA carboxylase subunit epsilon n=1 Tax=Micromonospora sp. WMMD730 TaxID=3404128 RepID=UPI003B928BCA
MSSEPPRLRVQRGRPSAEELAVVVAVLLTRRVPAPAPRSRTAGWHRRGPITDQYCPRSWRTATRASDRQGEVR